jgi:hypothetical protein
MKLMFGFAVDKVCRASEFIVVAWFAHARREYVVLRARSDILIVVSRPPANTDTTLASGFVCPDEVVVA